MLKREGWIVNAKRVYRLWRQAGLARRPKPKKRRRLGNSKNSCVRLRPNYPNHVWSYDFLFDATEDGRRLKWMPVLDEYTRECLALEVERSITSSDVIGVLDRLIAEREFSSDVAESHPFLSHDPARASHSGAGPVP